jgi:alpha-amylase
MKLSRVSAVIAAALVLSTLACSQLETLGGQSIPAAENRAIDPNILPAKKEQGVLLHAFYWTFDEVRERLPEIKDAGYSGVQVGPIQRTKEPGIGYESWWLLYQPASFRTIGNFQLGTDADFREMTAAADQLGIDIIVDAVINHVADNGNQSWSDAVDAELKNPDYYHGWGEIQEYRDRSWVTQGDLGGGPDLKTQHQGVQDMVTDFLNLALEAGADGFRFDAAKHIETEIGMDEYAEWKSDFWRDVLGRLINKDIYLVGEVIPNEAANEVGYVGMMDITAHDYIWTVMNAVNNHNLRDNLTHIPTHVRTLLPEDALVYIENHDSYHRGETSWYSYQNRIYGNAILFARDKVVPRIFDRETDDLWKDPVIVKAVAFHNQMMGYSEYFSNPNDSNQLLMIERRSGTVGKGALLINLGGNTSINTSTTMPNGTYVSEVDGTSTFTVSGGTLSGNIPTGVTILIDESTGPVPDVPTGLAASAVQDTQIGLSWDSVFDAGSYSLYSGASPSGPWTLLATQSGTSFTNTGLSAGTEYHYAVSASNANG